MVYSVVTEPALICIVILSDREQQLTLNQNIAANFVCLVFVVCLISLRFRDHPCILALIEGRGPKFIARSLAIPLATKGMNFLDPFPTHQKNIARGKFLGPKPCA